MTTNPKIPKEGQGKEKKEKEKERGEIEGMEKRRKEHRPQNNEHYNKIRESTEVKGGWLLCPPPSFSSTAQLQTSP